MQALELKVPPAVVALLGAAAMWLLSWLPPAISPPWLPRIVLSVALAIAGVAFCVSGVLAFRRARTTVNPVKPGSASSLVSTGVYELTRNPMYVGMLFLLLTWGTFLGSVWALLGPLLFIAYITRFQILPEERALRALFGAQFTAYQSRVHRWL